VGLSDYTGDLPVLVITNCKGGENIADLNTSIGPVLDGVILLFPTLLGLEYCKCDSFNTGNPCSAADHHRHGSHRIRLNYTKLRAYVRIRNLRWDPWQDPHLIGVGGNPVPCFAI